MFNIYINSYVWKPIANQIFIYQKYPLIHFIKYRLDAKLLQVQKLEWQLSLLFLLIKPISLRGCNIRQLKYYAIVL